jgi:serine/threonine-protein kinase
VSEVSRQQGQVIGGKYMLERVLGAGGMGEVWSARHTSLQTIVALKFLKGSSASEPEIRSRFELEARVTAQLKTRLAVQVFDYGVAEAGEPFLVMELLEGESLAQRLDRMGRFSATDTVHLLAQAARALDKAHALGIVHRDFKPGNIFIILDEDYREQVKVMDFGLAKIVGELETRSASVADLDDNASPQAFTRTGALLGTPSYMSPEQVAGAADIGPATDTWALGVVAFECLTGQLPFSGQRMSELFMSIRGRRFTLASALVQELPPEFDAWFNLACALEPAQRYATPLVAVLELAKALGVPAPLELSAPDRAVSAASYNSLPPAPRSGSGPVTIDGEEGSEPTLRPNTPSGAMDPTLSGRGPASHGGLAKVSGARAPSAKASAPSAPAPSAPALAPPRRAPMGAILGAAAVLVLGGVAFALKQGRDVVTPPAPPVARLPDAPVLAVKPLDPPPSVAEARRAEPAVEPSQPVAKPSLPEPKAPEPAIKPIAVGARPGLRPKKKEPLVEAPAQPAPVVPTPVEQKKDPKGLGMSSTPAIE